MVPTVPVAEASRDAWARHLGRRRAVSPVALRRWLGGGTIHGYAHRSLRARGRELLLDVDGRQATGDELLAAAGTVTRAVVGTGAAGSAAGELPRPRVLLSVPTSLELVAGYLGILGAGCSVVLANPSLTRPELERLIRTAGPSHGILSPAAHGLLETYAVPGTARKVDSANVLLAFAPEGGYTSSRGAQGIDAQRTVDALGTVDAARAEAVFALTSGTTGDPKGVPLAHRNLLASIRAVMASWRWGAGDVVVHALPLYHQHGLSSLHALALGGGRTVIRSRFDPEELAHVVRTERATMLLGVPAIYQRLVDAAPGRASFESLRLLVSGSAPLSPNLFGGIADLTGHTPLERYGTTESGLDVSNPYVGRRRPGSIGYPLPGVEVRVGAEQELPAGTDGEILVRGPQVFSGYLGKGVTNEATFAPGGWFRTGDIGRTDPEDGSLSITGRFKDIIITGGMNVYPKEVELVLEHHPGVATVAVAGVASERWGEAVCAFVVARPTSSLRRSDLAALCQGSLAPYKHPKHFVVVPDLPRNDMGKVVRAALPSLLVTGTELQ